MPESCAETNNTIIKKPIILLVDWRLEDKKFWLQEELERLGFDVFIEGIPNYSMKNRMAKWRKAILWWQYLTLGRRGAKLARRYDGTIVAWNFITGIFAALLCNSCRLYKLPVVALNMIAHNKAWVHDFLRKSIYNYAFSTGNMDITVNSESLKKYYLNNYRISAERIFVLQDPYHANYKFFTPDVEDKGYVFSGGEAERDWHTLIEVARQCPDVPFKIVARRMHWQRKDNIPDNLEVMFDTSEEEFYSLVRESRIVLLPLKTQVTAGLIVLIRSILLGRLVIVTATPGTSQYFPRYCLDLLVPLGDVEGMSTTLRRYWEDKIDRIEKTKYIQNFVLEKYSPQSFAKKVGGLVLDSYRSRAK